MKLAKIIHFINGVSPSVEDLEIASSMQAHVVFRNARVISSDCGLEDCDGVSGLVPETYESVFPKASEAIQTHLDKLSQLTSKVGDKQAPRLTVKNSVEGKASMPAWTPNTKADGV